MSKKFYLSRDKKITGVCGGIAERFGWEPSIVRIIAFLLFLLFRHYILMLYIILWIIMPSENS